jgi:hypothetical protein
MKIQNIIAGIAVGLALTLGTATAANSVAHVHMGHVSEGWTDTPDGKGLLPTAIAEARIALQHATVITKKTGDLEWMQLHAHHVLHALDAGLEKQGPGLGYGVDKAAAGVAKHIEVAANSVDASANVKAHAVHVATSARNTLGRSKQMKSAAQQILSAGSAATAKDAALKLHSLAVALLDGEDANGDGNITWQEGEGGLLEAQKHLTIMRKGEQI